MKLRAPNKAPTPVATFRGLRLNKFKASECTDGTTAAASEDRPVKAENVAVPFVRGKETRKCERTSSNKAYFARRRSKEILCGAGAAPGAVGTTAGLKREIRAAKPETLGQLPGLIVALGTHQA